MLPSVLPSPRKGIVYMFEFYQNQETFSN